MRASSLPPSECRAHDWAILMIALVMGGCALDAPAAERGPRLENSVYQVSVADDGQIAVAVRVQPGGTPPLTFRPSFTVLTANKDPKPELRYADFADPQMRDKYNVMSWRLGRSAQNTSAPDHQAIPKGHVADGFDPATDRRADPERTFHLFQAGTRTEFSATSFTVSAGRVSWAYAEQPVGTLSASMEVPPGDGEPVVTLKFTPKSRGWYSVGYTGAPEARLSEVDEVWQPLVWQEKRFPDRPYLTESGRCPLPATLVSRGGATWGVVADPGELPFQPMPTPANSRFGVAVRNASGAAQPMIFAPILGGPGSAMPAEHPYEFRLRFYVRSKPLVEAYEDLARGLYGFRDYRRNNGLHSLNRTLERAIDYAMSEWARFDEDLRGSAYETDVPGAVKNVSSLHPLSVALVTDDAAVFHRRARPMIEYALSREKFLFTTNPKVQGQGASAAMAGPCAPVSELAALYSFSGGRTPAFLTMARELDRTTRTLNLDVAVQGGSWQNSLAMFRATGDRAWLQQAVRGADRYLAGRVLKTQSDFSDPEARGMFFWTSFSPNWMELYELYEASGEARFLEAARAGAHRYAQYVWMCPVIPPGNVTVNEGGQAPRYRKGPRFPPIQLPEETVPAWRVSEIGLTPESSATSKGHRGIFLTSFAPWMLRLDRVRPDPFLHDIARSAVVGRYTSFPGYHMNTARTTVYEKPDFAERPMAQLNATTSIHYNHIWPQIAMLLDYLVADAENRSRGAIRFPSQFAEGYAYLQSKVYGHAPGTFYGDKDVWLWMPKGLIEFEHPELNYVAARSTDTLYLAFMNQSDEPVQSPVKLNDALVSCAVGRTYESRIWKDNGPVSSANLQPGGFRVEVEPRGLTAVAIRGIGIQPRFQQALEADSGNSSGKEIVRLEPFGVRGMILNFGAGRRWAYVYLQGREGISKATLHYSAGGSQKQLTDEAFPFEFSVPLEPQTHNFPFHVECETTSGTVRCER